jgi:hypothetical protein
MKKRCFFIRIYLGDKSGACLGPGAGGFEAAASHVERVFPETEVFGWISSRRLVKFKPEEVDYGK